MAKKSIGIIINPIAGIGGRVGLKGSDGEDTVERALALGARRESADKAGIAIEQLVDIASGLEVYAYGGEMGETLLASLGFEFSLVGQPAGEKTTAEDTIRAASAFRDIGVDLILFAGGDGTARNVFEAVGSDVPVIGVPAGVKIHSAVYATNPRNAGLVAKEYLSGESGAVQAAEVMDIDEALFRQGQVSAKLYGEMLVPVSEGRVQHMKSGGGSDEDSLAGMAEYIVDEMEADTIYIIGTGSTMQSIMADMGLANTLLGVDVIENKQLLASDVTESELWDLIRDPQKKVKIIVTIIGGQGYLFGRGNQQISPRVIRRAGIKNIIVAATPSKLLSLRGQPLLVDTGDATLDRELSGYIEVTIGYGHTSIQSVSS
jgi:predicted polyphosphate/ATP-dependent NAD kinase